MARYAASYRVGVLYTTVMRTSGDRKCAPSRRARRAGAAAARIFLKTPGDDTFLKTPINLVGTNSVYPEVPGTGTVASS